MPSLFPVRMHALHLLLLSAAAILLGLHYAHLAADFPNHSAWMDWSKYTDEGWYGDAAIRHFQLGHWYLAGDFNPAVALPVWPLLEGLLFAFTGVSLVAARALTVTVFAAILAVSWLLLASSNREKPSPARSVFASVAVLLLAANPFCFVFTRLAIIEPLLILLILLALLAAQGLPLQDVADAKFYWRDLPRDTLSAVRENPARIAALGLLLPLIILTKTTGLFVFPAIAWMLFARAGYSVSRLLRVAVPIALIGLSLWLLYFFVLVRPHYLLDYRYLFSANGYTGMTRANYREVLHNTVRGGMWMGRRLYPVALVTVALGLILWRRARASPLIGSLLLWVFGYAAFLAYHNNIQPRYYLVIAVPLTLLATQIAATVLIPALPGRYRFIASTVAATIAAIIAVPDVRQTIGFVRHPEYTLIGAANEVRDTIREDQRHDPAHNPLVLSISGSDLSLMTGVPSIDDDFGTLELGERVKRYRPGWYLAWNQIDDDKMDALTPLFHPERVATFPAMDDPDRNVLVLYRLNAVPPSTPPARPLKPIPRRLRTKVGQQPSASQLQH